MQSRSNTAPVASVPAGQPYQASASASDRHCSKELIKIPAFPICCCCTGTCCKKHASSSFSHGPPSGPTGDDALPGACEASKDSLLNQQQGGGQCWTAYSRQRFYQDVHVPSFLICFKQHALTSARTADYEPRINHPGMAYPLCLVQQAWRQEPD